MPYPPIGAGIEGSVMRGFRHGLIKNRVDGLGEPSIVEAVKVNRFKDRSVLGGVKYAYHIKAFGQDCHDVAQGLPGLPGHILGNNAFLEVKANLPGQEHQP